ncbi:phorbol ester/diacylglycerol-binding protein unc-13-like [Hyposmocoma kahamanoa]|uniref:phorbol ester/diacylglycerol-binding protein unc-13-like n=1 Tax=Hyposmocoma kahamanoa TaxID=1477025 RepID=UPI000E6DA4A2|nr:phorbol ester/diacylglycerol-binding protein unc-13-like [Hyposmocoma kahamanoa]
MSLLSVTVKKARYVGIQATQYNTYVTLKLQNVKSTTVTVKGPTPSWEQDFLFEINDINLGLLVEVWNKGVIWDQALGYHYLPLTSVAYNEQECGGRWIELEAQLMMRGGAVVGTTGPTGHALLLDCRFEQPFDAEGTAGADLQRKLDLLNGTLALDAERAEQARRQMQYIAHSGYSEDSDYTSDLNYPVGQHANCSASQFRSAAHQMHTPQRSLEVSRENSYEREEYHIHGDTDPLYYNSQPRTNRIETWSQLHAQASVESAVSWRTAADWQSGEEQRRPSLERQNTLYDDGMGFGYDSYTTSTHIRDHSHLSQQHSYEEYFDSSNFAYQTSYVGDDTRQWDSRGQYFFDDGYGLTPTEYENIINKRRSSVVQLPQIPSKQRPPSSRYSDHNEMTPYRPRPGRTAASLPATPSSTPKRGRVLPQPPGSESGSIRSGRGRRLPRAPYPPPAPLITHTVPYVPEPKKSIADYNFDKFGYQTDYQATATDHYQDNNYNTTYDEDGMQPFFDETPHATPPAAQKPWSETDTQFPYAVISGEDNLISKTMPSTISSYLPQPPVTTQQDTSYSEYQDTSYQQYEDTSYQQYEEQQFNQQYNKQEQYLDEYQDQTDFQQQSYDYQYQYQEDQQKQQYGEELYNDQQDYHQQNQYQQQQQEFQKQQQQFEQQKQHQQQQLQLQQQQKFQQQQQHLQQQQLQQQQQKQQPDL